MTDWSQFVAYDCRYCNEGCINRKDANCAQVGACKGCHRAASLDLRDNLLDERSLQSTASEAKGAPARPGAQRSEHPGPERERQSRSAPTRAAGSDPSRVDPEGRAHPPNPEGDGGNENGVTQPTDSPAKPR
jgi:hypothetical protein